MEKKWTEEEEKWEGEAGRGKGAEEKELRK